MPSKTSPGWRVLFRVSAFREEHRVFDKVLQLDYRGSWSCTFLFNVDGGQVSLSDSKLLDDPVFSDEAGWLDFRIPLFGATARCCDCALELDGLVLTFFGRSALLLRPPSQQQSWAHLSICDSVPPISLDVPSACEKTQQEPQKRREPHVSSGRGV